MAAPSTTEPSAGYLARLARNVTSAVAHLMRSPSDPRAAEAARKFRRDAFILMATGAIAVAVLMLWVDLPEIKLMPPRNEPSLWPVRILTDFGKAAFVMWTIAALLLAVTLAAPGARQALQPRLLRLMTELQYLVLAVLVPIMAGEVVKWIVGRGRPFVGPDPFTFSHFAGTSAYASFPSAHSITAVALAFAVSALWPKLRGLMIVYALLIIASRLVLLAHHPSDVVAGAIFGLIGAMVVRQWFAARRLGFTIVHGGAILPAAGPGA
ncbi:MAG TPA: phosphatase PAP2 family protein [Bradyrhizobium sp.]